METSTNRAGVINPARLAVLERTTGQIIDTQSAATRVESKRASTPPPFPPLDRETRVALPTDEAARHLNRSEQTLRIWACRENGPIRPLRIHGRLAWKTQDLRKLLGVAE